MLADVIGQVQCSSVIFVVPPHRPRDIVQHSRAMHVSVVTDHCCYGKRARPASCSHILLGHAPKACTGKASVPGNDCILLKRNTFNISMATVGPWTDEETTRLRDLVHKHGASSWTTVAAELGTRNSKQCR